MAEGFVDFLKGGMYGKIIDWLVGLVSCLNSGLVGRMFEW